VEFEVLCICLWQSFLYSMALISFGTLRRLFLLSLHFFTVFSSTCYYPDKSIASNDLPCTNSTVSACCASDSYCLDNGLCITDMVLNRGSCTDQTWKSAECAQYCQDCMIPLLFFLSVLSLSTSRSSLISFSR
jgi:hypothetical protein